MKPEKIHFILFLLVFGIINLYYLSQAGWLDADSYAFFNQTCQTKFDLQVPDLSKAIFHLLPCDMLVWKILGFVMMFAVFSSFYYGAKKLCLPEKYVWFIGLSGWVITFLLSPEDDLIAYPIIVASSFWLLSEITYKKILVYLGVGLLLTAFVWKGAIIPMGIIGLGALFPLLGLLPLLYLLPGFFNSWGKSSEVVWGAGSAVNNFILIPLLFVLPSFKDKNNFSIHCILSILCVLSFFQPKWGEYIIIPAFALLPLLYQKLSSIPLLKYLENFLVILSILFLLLFSLFSIYTMVPTQPQWEVIKETVYLQKHGYPLYNEWGVGHYIEYLGGTPSQKGGYKGPQYPTENSFFWLGFDQNFPGYTCKERLSKDNLILYECFKYNPLIVSVQSRKGLEISYD